MKKLFFSLLLAVFIAVPARHAFAQSSDDLQQRGEWMMSMMMGSDHDAFDRELETERGEAFSRQMHETLGRMALRSGTGSFGSGPMGMMGGWGRMDNNWGTAAFIGWLWLIVWTVNSVLVGVLLWVLIKKYSKQK